MCVLYLRVYLHYFFNEKKKKKKERKHKDLQGQCGESGLRAPESRGPVVRSRQFQSRPPLTHSRTLAKWLASLGLGFSF